MPDPDAFIALLERPGRKPGRGCPDFNRAWCQRVGVAASVVVAGVNEVDFPHYSRDTPLSDERLEEERRLFYVAITREKRASGYARWWLASSKSLYC